MKTIDFLMTGEGPTDYGQKVYGANQWEEGPAAVLARRCAEETGAEIILSFADRRNVEQIKLGRSVKGLSGKAVPARRFHVLMRKEGYENGIYYCDADREAGTRNTRHQAEERFNKIYDEVNEGANPEEVHTKIIPMIALRMIESWLMADESLFRGNGKPGKKGKRIECPQEPEMLWGDKRDPDSNYPKNYLDRLYMYYYNCKPRREEMISIAENSDIAKIARKCPISFGRFREDFQSYLESIK